VLEAVEGYLLLAEALAKGIPDAAGAWNFGPSDGDHRSVAWMAGELAERWGDGAVWQVHNPTNAPYEERLLAVNAEKAATKLGWRARWSVDRALDYTVPWYRAQLGDRPIRALSVEQIEEHANAA
jgi:CDP-glucose 4,6-dehydratase